IDVSHESLCFRQLMLFAQDYRITFRKNFQHKHWLAKGNSQTFALPDSEIWITDVLPYHGAIRQQKITGSDLIIQGRASMSQKLSIIVVRNETNLIALGFIRQLVLPHFQCHLFDLRFMKAT